MVSVWNGVDFFFQAEDGIRDIGVTGVQTCALPISEPVAEPMVIIHGDFPSVSAQITVVTLRRRGAQSYGKTFSGDNHVLGIAAEPFESKTQLILQETHVNTQVEGFYTLPTDVMIDEFRSE